MISGVLLLIIVLSILLPIGCGLFTFMFILQHKRLQRIRQRRRLFRRASSFCEQQRKKMVADVLLSDVCPLYIYEGVVDDGTRLTVNQNEPIYLEGTESSSVKSPCQVWQSVSEPVLSPVRNDSSSTKYNGTSSCHSLRNPGIERNYVDKSGEYCDNSNSGTAERTTPHDLNIISDCKKHLLSSSFVDSESSEDQYTCLATDECSICLDSIRVGDYMRKLPCGHMFHATCVEKWLLHAHRCPLCNKDLVSCLNGSVSMENDDWLMNWAQSERRRRPGWNRPFAHIRYLFQEYPFEWNRLQVLLTNNATPTEISEDVV